MNSRAISPLLVAGDVVCFVLFAIVGLSSHEKDYSAAALARTILPFLLPWLAIAYASGLYSPKQADTSGVARPVLLAWIPAWAVGLALRSLVWGRAFAPAFAIVTLLISGALLLGWRATQAAMSEKQARQS